MTIDLIVRTSLVLAAAWVMTRCLTRAAAATRHVVWQYGVIAVLAAPLLGPIAPKFRVPHVLDVPGVPRMPGVPGVPEVPGVPGAPQMLFEKVLGTDATVPHDSREIARTTASTPGTSTSGTVGTPGTLATWWLLGAGLVSLWFLATHGMAALLSHRARPASPAVQAASDTFCEQLGIARYVPVAVLDSTTSPFTAGILRPHIVLPASAEAWDGERLSAVLLHELAHVRRRDCGIQAVGQAACAVYWFNPLIWVAARGLRSERERACDDEVLTRGARASAYAAQLLESARGARTGLAAPALLSMARPRELEGRLLAILAAGRSRVPARASRWVVAVAIGATTLAALGGRAGADVTVQPLRSAALTAAPPALAGPVEQTPAAPPPASTRPLISALSNPNGQVREKAALSLALDSNPDVIPALIAALGDPDAQVREKAALGLASRGDERVVEPLITALGDADSQVREKAAIALGTTGNARAVAPLEKALNDADAQVREKAVIGLMLLRSPASVHDGEALRGALRRLVTGLLTLTR